MKKLLTFLVLSLGILNISFAGYTTGEQIEAANNLAEQKIINNHATDPENYNLDSHVLRQEIAAVARGVAMLEKKDTCDNIFADLSATNPNSWACVNVEVLVDNDLISANTNFRPEDFITKAETL
jgi:Na+-translocating ferredoxin:NAD+ oxidoreductase RnfC subunit